MPVRSHHRAAPRRTTARRHFAPVHLLRPYHQSSLARPKGCEEMVRRRAIEIPSIVPRYVHPAIRELVKEMAKPRPDLERTREMIGYLMTAQLNMEDLTARGHPDLDYWEPLCPPPTTGTSTTRLRRMARPTAS